MSGVDIPTGESLKLLGLTLDRHLNYLQHIKDVTNKAVKLYKSVARTARAHWGLNSDIIKTIYTAVVEPTILYAANVWAIKGQTVQVRSKLEHIGRLFGIMICKGHKTISYTACTVLAGIIPLDLRAMERRELYEVKNGKPLQQLPGRKLESKISPFALPHPAQRVKINFNSIVDQSEAVNILANKFAIFTDGSKIEGKVGAAYTMWKDGKELRRRKLSLAGYCSIFQAELVAIREAIQMVKMDKRLYQASICSDSRSSLDCLKNPNMLHPLVEDIRKLIKELEDNDRNIDFYWVKAHTDIMGNERADELAKAAALKLKVAPIYDCFPLSLAKRLIRDSSLTNWQLRYSEANTGATTRNFFPCIKDAYKSLKCIKMDNLTSQILSGHGGFKAYLHKFKLSPDPFCICDASTQETVEHVITECPRYTLARYDCECRMDMVIVPGNFGMLINNDNFREVFLEFARTIVRKAVKANGSTAT